MLLLKRNHFPISEAFFCKLCETPISMEDGLYHHKKKSFLELFKFNVCKSILYIYLTCYLCIYAICIYPAYITFCKITL